MKDMPEVETESKAMKLIRFAQSIVRDYEECAKALGRTQAKGNISHSERARIYKMALEFLVGCTE